jgi:hypothetical protein
MVPVNFETFEEMECVTKELSGKYYSLVIGAK